jgi:hypothetical protein
MVSIPASILIKWAFHDFEEQAKNPKKGLSSLAGDGAEKAGSMLGAFKIKGFGEGEGKAWGKVRTKARTKSGGDIVTSGVTDNG